MGNDGNVYMNWFRMNDNQKNGCCRTLMGAFMSVRVSASKEASIGPGKTMGSCFTSNFLMLSALPPDRKPSKTHVGPSLRVDKSWWYHSSKRSKINDRFKASIKKILLSTVTDFQFDLIWDHFDYLSHWTNIINLFFLTFPSLNDLG